MTQLNIEEFSRVDNTLRAHLRPYHPDPGFVSSLKHRITQVPGVEIELPPSNAQLLVKAIAIICGFAVLFWILRRLAGGR